MRLDEHTVYQIFWMTHQGIPKTEIAYRLRLARNTVTAHLSGRLKCHYSKFLRTRVSRLEIPAIRHRETPKGYITISEASYFFERRPTPKSILNRYDMRIRLIDGVNYTTIDWAKQCAKKKNNHNLEGVCMTRDAAKYLYGVQAKQPIVQLIEIDSSETPASLVHAAVGIMEWTQLKFVTFDAADVMRLS